MKDKVYFSTEVEYTEAKPNSKMDRKEYPFRRFI